MKTITEHSAAAVKNGHHIYFATRTEEPECPEHRDSMWTLGSGEYFCAECGRFGYVEATLDDDQNEILYAISVEAEENED